MTAKLRSILLAFFAVALAVPAICGELDVGERVKIFTDEAVFNREKAQFTIPGEAVIKSGDLILEGTGLLYDRNTNTGQFEGGPVHVKYGKNLRGVIAKLSVDLEAGTLRASGGRRS